MNDTLIKHGLIVFIGSTIINLLNYIFQLVMARLLSTVEYGSLIALFSLFLIFSVPSTSINAILSKYSSIFVAQKKFAKIKYLFSYYTKIMLFFMATILLFFVLLNKFIADFLKISPEITIIILSVSICLAYFNSIITGTLSGLQYFLKLVSTNILTALMKLVSGIVFVAILGFGLVGAVSSLAVGFALSIIAGTLFLKNLLIQKTAKFDVSKTFSYSLTILLAFVALNVLGNIDMILVKHFLSDHEAGIYAAGTQLSKIIFFSTAALGVVLLPKASSAKTLNKKPEKILQKTLALALIISAIATIAYFVFPQFLINLLIGPKYVEISPFLGLIALAISFFSLSNLLSLYFISVNRQKFVFLLFLFVILEVALIFLYHSSIYQIITNLLLLQGLLLFSLLIYYFVDFRVSKVDFY